MFNKKFTSIGLCSTLLFSSTSPTCFSAAPTNYIEGINFNQSADSMRELYFQRKQLADIFIKKIKEITKTEELPDEISKNYSDINYWASRYLGIIAPTSTQLSKYLDYSSSQFIVTKLAILFTYENKACPTALQLCQFYKPFFHGHPNISYLARIYTPIIDEHCGLIRAFAKNGLDISYLAIEHISDLAFNQIKIDPFDTETIDQFVQVYSAYIAFLNSLYELNPAKPFLIEECHIAIKRKFSNIHDFFEFFELSPDQNIPTIKREVLAHMVFTVDNKSDIDTISSEYLLQPLQQIDIYSSF